MSVVNVLFNSNNKVSGTNSNANYYIDWAAILKDNKKYLVQFNYLGQSNTFTAASKIATLNINIQGQENYITGNYGAGTSNMLGFLWPGNALPMGLYATSNDNTPVFLNNRPTSNNVNVQILTNDNPPVEWLDNAAIPVEPNNYIFSLTFSELENTEKD